MPGTIPDNPKIYHIVHIDRLASIIQSNGLLSDAQMVGYQNVGTTIGMTDIKQRRLTELKLQSHPDLYVGQCVPFYFCPRSVMLYMFWKNNSPDLQYEGGQEPILHLEADLHQVVDWANQQNIRWAFTTSNAGAYLFEDMCDLTRLSEIDWSVINSRQWSGRANTKAAEFLIENSFPWELVTRIGVYSQAHYSAVNQILFRSESHKLRLEIKREWYY